MKIQEAEAVFNYPNYQTFNLLNMKKTYLGLVAIAAMMVSSCTQDEEQLAVNQDVNEVFTGKLDVDSRTSLSADKEVVWDADDKIVIFKKTGYKQRYKVSQGANTIMAKFSYDGYSTTYSPSATQNYAVYPFDEGYTISNNTISLDLSNLAEQNYAEGTFEDGKSVMTAKSSTTDLSFYNALSMLRVRLNAGAPGDAAVTVGSITITSSSQALAGNATIDMSVDKPYATFTSTEVEDKTITLTLDTPITLTKSESEGGHEFYILVPATTFEAGELTITICNDNGSEIYEAVYPESLECLRSEITTIEHTFGDVYNGIIEKEKVTLPLSDLATTTFEDGKIYALSGTFTEDVTITVPAGMNIVIDGSDADLAGKHLIVKTDAANWVNVNAPQSLASTEKTGEYTYQGFTSGNLSIQQAHTTVNVVSNELTALDIAGGNLTLNIKDNKIDGNNAQYKRYDSGTLKNGVYLYTVKYELNFTGNEILNTASGAFCVYGWGGDGENWRGYTNDIKSFSQNTLQASEDDDAVISFAGDGSYNSTNGTKSDKASALVTAAKDNNTFTKATGVNQAYKFKFMDNSWSGNPEEQY